MRLVPGMSAVTTVDFVCRDAAQNWWALANGVLIRFDPYLNFTGLMNGGSAFSGKPAYDGSTNRIYWAFAATYPIQYTHTGWPYPVPTVINTSASSFGLKYIDLSMPTGVVTQLPCYVTPWPSTSTTPPPSRDPRFCIPDGVGRFRIGSSSQGEFWFDVASGSVQAATGSAGYPSVILDSGLTSWVALPGSCATSGQIGFASTCLWETDISTSNRTGRTIPVDFAVPGVGTTMGGQCVGIFPDRSQVQMVAVLLQNSTTTTYLYAVDVTSPSIWPGCGGVFTRGPTVEQTSIAVEVQVPGSLAWLCMSFGRGSIYFPELPPGCLVHLNPASLGFVGPTLLNAQGQGGWQLQIPIIPAIDNTALYFQCGYMGLLGFGASEARSAIIRQH